MRYLSAIQRYAAGVRRDQSSQDVEKSALAAAAGSNNGNELSWFSFQADLPEDLQRISASGEGLCEVFNLNKALVSILFHIKKPLSLRGKAAM
jgi:hypothetical protein